MFSSAAEFMNVVSLQSYVIEDGNTGFGESGQGAGHGGMGGSVDASSAGGQSIVMFMTL